LLPLPLVQLLSNHAGLPMEHTSTAMDSSFLDFSGTGTHTFTFTFTGRTNSGTGPNRPDPDAVGR
ncbi:MAG TPA: hypothetical protein VI197_20010, partial [Polyangiaceae bacterium]